MRATSALIAILCIALASCGREAEEIALPREPGPDAIGHYCRMSLAEHKGPKGQILPKGWTEPLWFSSVRDALTYVEQDIVSDEELAGFWVNDMAQGTWENPAPRSWIDARTAWYVVASKKMSGMGGTEAVPFKERAAAELFARDYGGRVADFMAARRESAEANAAGIIERGGS
jgi:copper chaperone NosL